MPQTQIPSKFIIIGNHTCLDFINTQISQGGQVVDLLEDFTDLVHWLGAVQVLDAAEAQAVRQRWSDTSEARRAFEQALAFRAVLREMIEGLVEGRPVQPATIAEINRLLRQRVYYLHLVETQGRFTTHPCLEFDAPIQLLTPIAEAASDLLEHADFALVKKCENPDCILYFYDTSKNHARRWCSMRMCGNRLKVAAFYRRRRHI